MCAEWLSETERGVLMQGQMFMVACCSLLTSPRWVCRLSRVRGLDFLCMAWPIHSQCELSSSYKVAQVSCVTLQMPPIRSLMSNCCTVALDESANAVYYLGLSNSKKCDTNKSIYWIHQKGKKNIWLVLICMKTEIFFIKQLSLQSRGFKTASQEMAESIILKVKYHTENSRHCQLLLFKNT